MTDAPIGELQFLRKLQRLLAEGDFVATYKFALLNALADLSLELKPAADGSLRVPVSALAEKFIEYCRRRARIAPSMAPASCCCRTRASKRPS